MFNKYRLIIFTIVSILTLAACGNNSSDSDNPGNTPASRLYVNNDGTHSVSVFNSPSSADGNIAPTRTISGGMTTLSDPRGIWLD